MNILRLPSSLRNFFACFLLERAYLKYKIKAGHIKLIELGIRAPIIKRKKNMNSKNNSPIILANFLQK